MNEPNSRRAPAVLAITGLVAPVWFATLVIVQGALQPSYSHIAMPISALAAWPLGWVQIVNFFVEAALQAGFTIAVHLGVRPTRYGMVGIALLLTSSVGLVVAGAFPWLNVNGVPTETPAHVVGAVLFFASASIGLMVLAARLAADPPWADLATYVRATGIAMFVLFIAVGFFAIDDGTPLHPWAGLLQRILVFIWMACLVVIALRLLRLARRPAPV